jgi:hypothetical protein
MFVYLEKNWDHFIVNLKLAGSKWNTTANRRIETNLEVTKAMRPGETNECPSLVIIRLNLSVNCSCVYICWGILFIFKQHDIECSTLCSAAKQAGMLLFMTQWLLYVPHDLTLTDSALSPRMFVFHMNLTTHGDFLSVRHPQNGPSKWKSNVSCSDYQFVRIISLITQLLLQQNAHFYY